jgi:hypothetical protein
MIKNCKSCEQEKQIYARGLCRNCYVNASRAGNLDKYRPFKKRLSKCKGCGNKRKIVAKGMCNSCYLSSMRVDKKIGKEKLIIQSPDASKDEVRDFIKQKEEEVLDDILNDPRKWLDSVK